LHQLEHKNAPDPRQAEWKHRKLQGNGLDGRQLHRLQRVNPPASSGRPPKMNYPNDNPSAAENLQQGAVSKPDSPILQIFGNVQQGTPPINLPPAATAAATGDSEAR